jgi:virulence-associated protein VagC
MVKLISETPTVTSNVVNYTVTVALDPVDAAAILALSTAQTTPGTSAGRARTAGAGGQSANTPGASDNRTSYRPGFPGQPSDNRTGSDNRTSYRPAFPGQLADNRTVSDNRTFTRRPFAGQGTGSVGQSQQTQSTTTLPQDFRLREGLTVTVSIIAEQRTNIVLVPNKAITSRSGKYYVQVLSDGKTSEKMIQAGITDGQNTEIVSGLSEGDQVSTATNIVTTTTTAGSQQRQQTPSIPGVGFPR